MSSSRITSTYSTTQAHTTTQAHPVPVASPPAASSADFTPHGPPVAQVGPSRVQREIKQLVKAITRSATGRFSPRALPSYTERIRAEVWPQGITARVGPRRCELVAVEVAYNHKANTRSAMITLWDPEGERKIQKGFVLKPHGTPDKTTIWAIAEQLGGAWVEHDQSNEELHPILPSSHWDATGARSWERDDSRTRSSYAEIHNSLKTIALGTVYVSCA